MPKLSGIFKSSDKSSNQVGSELSNENIKTISLDPNGEDHVSSNNGNDVKKNDLSELIPLAKSKKSSSCFQLHSYDNVYIRRVINPIKEEEPPKFERRKSLRNEIFKSLRINTIFSGIKGSLNSAPVKDDTNEIAKSNKIEIKNAPKTAAIEKNFDKLRISEGDDLGQVIEEEDEQSQELQDTICNSEQNTLIDTDNERDQSHYSLNAYSDDNIKYIGKNTTGSTPTIIRSATGNTLGIINENCDGSMDSTESIGFHSENTLQAKKKNMKQELTIDTSQPKEKKKRSKFSAIITPSSKSLPWIRGDRKKNKKNEIVSASVLDDKTPRSFSDGKSLSVPNSGNSANDMEDSATPTPTPSTASNDSPTKSPKRKKLYFSKEGMVIGKVKATDVRIISKLYNEYKEDFHKRIEFDFVCTEARKKGSFNQYLYNPTDLIYNNTKAFFFYEPTISIGSLKDVLKCSKGFKDEMEIYTEEMLCTFKKLVSAVYWLHNTYQIIHRRIDPSRILFDTSGQFKLTGLEWAFRISDHDQINIQQEYNFHEALVHSFNNNEKNEPIFFAPEICELNSDYFTKISTKIDVYSCGMILAAMNFGYTNLSSITVEQEHQKKFCLNNNASSKDDVKLIKNRHLIPDIIYNMLLWKPYERISMKEIVNSDWFRNISVCSTTNDDISASLNVTNDEIIHTHLNIPGQKCKNTTA